MVDKTPGKDSSSVGKSALDKISKLTPNPENQKLILVSRINEALEKLSKLKNNEGESETKSEE